MRANHPANRHSGNRAAVIRNPVFSMTSWIPGSACSRPGMTAFLLRINKMRIDASQSSFRWRLMRAARDVGAKTVPVKAHMAKPCDAVTKMLIDVFQSSFRWRLMRTARDVGAKMMRANFASFRWRLMRTARDVGAKTMLVNHPTRHSGNRAAVIRNPVFSMTSWIPGSACSHPGMTTAVCIYPGMPASAYPINVLSRVDLLS